MGWKLKGLGGLLILVILTATLLAFVWAVAKIGIILASFLAGLVVGFCVGVTTRKK